jgi:5-methylcytosine-specific restriction endonuclease McrA
LPRRTKAELAAYARRYTQRFPWKRALASAKHRASTRGIPFNLTEADVRKAYEPGTCAYCGTPCIYGTTKRQPGNSGQLDRIDPALGYTKGNVVLACAECNNRKGDMLPMHLRWLADRIEEVMRLRR